MSASPTPPAPDTGPDAGEVVAALRTHQYRLSALVDRLDEAALTGPSGAAKWRVCDVLSHLGSGAEIMLPAVAAAVAGVAPGELSPPPLSNQSVWDPVERLRAAGAGNRVRAPRRHARAAARGPRL